MLQQDAQNIIYDVAIIGAGLAGLTLARQILLSFPHFHILILHDGAFPNPVAAHKVGESSVEIGAYYLAETLRLGEYLKKEHLLKMGLRFMRTKGDFYEEMGITDFPWNDAYQLDRGKLENDLFSLIQENENVDLYENHRFIDFEELPDEGGIKKIIVLTQEGKERDFQARWVVDASGRKKCLSKKFSLSKKLTYPLTHSAAWFRVDSCVDVNDIYCDDVPENIFYQKKRFHSTIHMMGEGYWVWIIPLVGGKTSIGIVFDEEIIDSSQLFSQEGVFNFLKENEELLYKHLQQEHFKILDFKYYRKYSYLSEKFLSSDHWALTGEAFGFIDPLYSTGTDLISFSNTVICNAIGFEEAGAEDKRYIETYNEGIALLYDLFFFLHYRSYKNFKSWYYIFVKTNMDALLYFGTLCTYFMNNMLRREIYDHVEVTEGLSLFRRVKNIYEAFAEFLHSEDFIKSLPEKDANIPRFIDINRSIEAYMNRDIRRNKKLDPQEIYEILNKNIALFEEAVERLKNGEDFQEIFYDFSLYQKYSPEAEPI